MTAAFTLLSLIVVGQAMLLVRAWERNNWQAQVIMRLGDQIEAAMEQFCDRPELRNALRSALGWPPETHR